MLVLDEMVEELSYLEETFLGEPLERFLGDRTRQRAAIHALLVLGEAAKRVPESLRQKHPEIPWRKMAAMRDRLIHGYHDVSLEVVWRTVTVDAIPLAPWVKALRDEARELSS